MKKIYLAVTALAMLFSAEAMAAKANYCGELRNAYGPFDYRRRAEFTQNFDLVENAHFTAEVENGIKGISSTIGGDLDYTLRAIPNHHRALATLAMLARRERGIEGIQIHGMNYAAECYFIRALRLAPDDGVVHSIYGSYLFSTGQVPQALAILKQGYEYDQENASLNYNLGLIYTKQKVFDKARFHAAKAYAAGFPLPGLKNQLIAANQWEEPSKK